MDNIIKANIVDDIIEKKRLSVMSDNIYYNVVLTNNQSNAYLPVQYVDNRASAILKSPTDYYCAVTRFKVPITAIPILIFRNDYYYIQISYGGVNYPDPTLPTFVNYISTGSSSDGSQNIFTLQQFIDCVNQKILDLYTLVANANPLDPNFPRDPGNNILYAYAPYITFDSTTNFFTFHAWSVWGNVNANGNGNPPPFKPPNP